MFFKLMLYLLFIFSLFGCAIQEKDINIASGKEIKFNQFIGYYFPGYSITYRETNYKEEAYNKIFFIKKRLIEKDIDVIVRKMINDGWYLVDEADGYYYFCYGTNYSLGVVIPRGEVEYKKDGSEIKFFKEDSVNFTFSYLRYGIYSCVGDS